MKQRPHGPTSPVKPDTRGRGDTPPPAPPRELGRQKQHAREFVVEGRAWVARLAGKGAYGTGGYGLGLIDAIHFAHADTPDRPLFEALIAHGRFGSLFDSEFAGLLERATPIVLD